MFRRCTRAGLVKGESSSRACVNGGAFEPDFAPPQMDAARTEYPPAAIKRFAADVLEEYTAFAATPWRIMARKRSRPFLSSVLRISSLLRTSTQPPASDFMFKS